ncbi:FtsL-like putative cell division protein [Prevotella sp. 10(H)]|uniref:FtsL-like putative cell division protein n=1 Tax=Prevotella sp. 10(H) TaxID=1158294 RepID=UPI0004A76850|nr:FtsL-like putative cell division protein [Prevotella sp. 10(H)]
MKAKDIKKKVMYILGGTVFTEDFFWKNARFIITVFIILVLYISNRYSCIEKRAKIESLQYELKDAKFESLTIASQLMSVSRESKVEALVQQNGVEIEQTKEPIYKIKDK